MKKIREILELAYKYRYLVALIIFIFCVVFEINGSSIGLWKYSFDDNTMDSGELFGKSRYIRSDEFIVNTPLAISQYYNDFKYTSDIVRANSNTDMFIIYGQPVKDISIIFRIFQIGYLFLSPGKGLAFFWCSRIIVLFLATFEFSKIVTNKNRKLALIASLLISFSPVVAWWFAINYLIEMIVFAEIALIFIDKLMQEDKFKLRALYITIIAWCAGSFALSLYPAWLISMVYIFLPFLIWIIHKNYKNCKLKIKDLIPIIINLTGLVILIGRIFIKSEPAIIAMMNTVYPGERCETGGGGIWKILLANVNLISSFLKKDDFSPLNVGKFDNTCEIATVIDFLPVTIIIISGVLTKDKVKDFLLNICIIFSIFLNFYCIVGIPVALSKITLLSNVSTSRLTGVIGILNVFILVRSLALIKSNVFDRITSLFISISIAGMLSFIIYRYLQDFIYIRHIVIMMLLFVLAYYFLLQIKRQEYELYFLMTVCAIAFISTFYVNPVRSGLDIIENNKLGKEIVRINAEEDGVWMTQGINGNFPIMYGLKCINSTNVYPNLDRWEILDTKKEYTDIYNRYAHIPIGIDNVNNPLFELNSIDSFQVIVNLEQLNALNVKYILTYEDFSKKGIVDDNLMLDKISNMEGYNIYKIVEKEK